MVVLKLVVILKLVVSTEVGGGQSTLDQVIAIAVAAGVELTQEQIDKVVSDVESGVTTDIETAVKEAGGLVQIQVATRFIRSS